MHNNKSDKIALLNHVKKHYTPNACIVSWKRGGR